MTKLLRYLLPVALGWTMAAELAAEDAAPPAPSNLGPTKQRDQIVAAAQKLTQVPDPASLQPPTALKDPFDPADFKTTTPTADHPAENAGPAVPAPPAALKPEVTRLAAIAAQLDPDGEATINGVTYLLFANGNQRKKAGDTLGIIYKGEPLLLTITQIDPTTEKFTIRLEGQETTRDIKSK